MAAVLEARQLAKTYETGGAKVLGLRGVDISIERDGRPDPMSHHDASGRVAGSIAGAR